MTSRPPRRRRWWIAAALVLAALAAALFAARWFLLERPLPLAAERVEFKVKPGASLRAAARAAHQAGVGLNVDALALLARLDASTAPARAGRYAVVGGETLASLLARLRAGDTLKERLTIVEGTTFRELRALLAAHPDLQHDTDSLEAAALLKAVGATESHPEGLFAPDTYLFDAGSSDLEVLRQAYRAQQRLLASAWSERAADLPYGTPYEALIMASIIEKETGRGDERPQIAGVFVNRLRKGMLLQTDPTVIYGLGERFDGNLRKRDLQTDTPYNSYTRAGLPPTPIAAPGRASLDAALRPAPTRALYFVARGDGSSHFSETLAEHNRAVDKYQRGGR